MGYILLSKSLNQKIVKTIQPFDCSTLQPTSYQKQFKLQILFLLFFKYPQYSAKRRVVIYLKTFNYWYIDEG